ncbi:coproporphyrinogen III oxidase [Myroides ceti]|uniref:Coproporphyrinogen III oxidase n=1 Tax=Paenimyroides ceti TaxID=395087 RepID=A0ABT8D079_9FLAO|nr:coproporphyrinogen III oxidase [Paenimyroides ceti]MDN3710253.1 coproporphyrinogen III oxidase [Paenimyroides ceti]
MKEKFYQYIQNLQDQITSALEKVDGKSVFRERPVGTSRGGGGRTRVIENGNVF